MSHDPSTAPLRFAVRHDGDDAIRFYAMLLCLWFPMGIALLLILFGSVLMCLVAVSLIAASLISSMRLVWRRFAEKYELTATELIVDFGYVVSHYPLSTASKLVLDPFIRSESSAKRVHCIRFDDPKAGSLFVDVSPVDAEGFAEAFLSRCPQLTLKAGSSHRRPPGGPGK